MDQEEEWYWRALWLNILFAVIAGISLTRVTAPYGRHHRSSSRIWGPSIPAKDGWIIMESPALWVTVMVFWAGRHSQEAVPGVLLGFFQLHYAHRVLVYPLRMRSNGKSISILIAFLSFVFNVYNGYLQARWISHVGSYSPEWFTSARFVLGSTVFLTGMTVNIWSDHVLIGLRKPDESGYRLPRGGPFEIVACPNYAGEILEWLGWAVMTWSPAGLVFFVFTAANLVPRAVAHRRWYMEKFDDFPASRKAVLPFVI